MTLSSKAMPFTNKLSMSLLVYSMAKYLIPAFSVKKFQVKVYPIIEIKASKYHSERLL